jgi:hypothetical protein
MRGIEAGLMKPKQEKKPVSNDEYSIQRAEYFVDRIINNKPNDRDSIEHEAGYLEMHVQELLDILSKPQSPDTSKIREETEQILIKLFKNAEYKDSKQLDSPPPYRKYTDQYSGSMKKIYAFLALQTLASSGNVTKDYDHLSFFPKHGDMSSAVISALKKHDKGETTDAETLGSNRLLIAILEDYGISSKDTINAWKLSGYDREEDQIALGAMQNLEAIRYLAHASPGSVKVLYNQFGIRHFGRYPENVLLEQYKERDSSAKPYGVMFSAVADHNGAFRKGLWRDTRDLWKHLKGKYSFRIFEVDRKFSIGRRFVECDAKYGKHQKISFAKFNGHGQKNRVTFGKNNESTWRFIVRTFFNQSESTSISSKDLEGEGFKRAKNFFIQSPHFLFTACSAGEQGGIVQKASKIYGGEALGQDYIGSDPPLRPIFDDKSVIEKFVADPPEWESLIGRYRNGERL